MQEVRCIDMNKRHITEYEVTREFGGYEEGGWYFSVTTHISTRKAKSNKKAIELCEKLNEEEGGYGYMHDGYVFFKVEEMKHIGRLDDTDKPVPRWE